MNRKFGSVAAVFLVGLLLVTGCAAAEPPNTQATNAAPESEASAEPTSVDVDAPEEEAPAAESFVDGVLTTEEVQITITDYRVIPAGEVGNEYGDVPVLAIWYDTKNLGTSDRDISPMEFIFMFEAFQDNDPNRENTLDVAALPDDAFLDTQLENIKAGGTLSNAIAYELDDTITPVDLVAGKFGDEIGRMTFNLN